MLNGKDTSNKTNYVNGDVTKEHINHAVDNNGSRFGFKLKQSLGGDFYALGRAEWRMRGEAPSNMILTMFILTNFMLVLATNNSVN